jgi:thioesterase domain-containing protein
MVCQELDRTGKVVAAGQREATFKVEAGAARVVQLRGGCPGPSLIMVPGTGGRVEGFAPLATLLETSMSVFAIEARGLDGATEPDSDIEHLVDHYLSRIATVQADGPYFLLGHSYGGMVAFEMAQRLLAMNERIACLIFLDTVMPKRYWPRRIYLNELGRRLCGHLIRLKGSSLQSNFNYYFRRVRLRIRGLHNIPADMKIGHDSARMLLANEMVQRKWDPGFYPDKLTLFWSTDMQGLARVWDNRARELEIHSALGGHTNLIEHPNVRSLAADISECLARASRTMLQPC